MADLFPRDPRDLAANGEEMLGRLMNNFWGERASINTDIKEYDDHYEVKADLPGINKDSIKVTYANDTLTISAKQSSESSFQNDNGRFLRKERSSSSFERSFTIRNVDEENIKATFDNGVLSLTLGKRIPKELHGKDIPIEWSKNTDS